MNVTIVDSEPAMRALLDELEHLPTQPPSLYLDLEGVRLSRHGSVSIIQIFVLPSKHVFLVDVFILKEAAFSTSNRSGTSLRSILESALVPKVFFDVRNDSDALFAHFQISLAGVYDVQLLEVASRRSWKERVTGLTKCIEKDAQLRPEASASWKATKEKGLLHFAPEYGGSHQVFNSRPMLQEIVDYCTQDVVYLPNLLEVYSRKISREWMEKVRDKTDERIVESQKASYEPHGKNKILSPWAKPAKPGRGDPSSSTKARSPETKKMAVLAQLAATEAAKKTTATQPDPKPKIQRSLGLEASQQPSQPAALEAAKKAPEVTIPHGPPLPNLDLPVRSKNPPKGVSHKKIAPPTTYPAIHLSKWTCTTCSREMQAKHKEPHLAGKPHIARVKQNAASSLSSSSSSPIGAVVQQQLQQKKSLVAPSTTIAAKTTSVVQSGTENQPNPPQKKKKKQKAKKATAGTNTNTNYNYNYGRTKPAAAPQPQQQQISGLPYPPDHVFVGFGGYSSRGGGYGGNYGRGYYDKGDDFGLCDKDCGWCGHCMDGVDV